MFDRSAIALLLLAGCNEIYGLEKTRVRDAYEGGNGELLVDLDLDGISDEVDPCLAPMRDGLDDLDEDTVIASSDPCPMDAGTTNGDGDMLPDVCDPFPAIGGDRLRCFMSFGSTDLNATLWKPRDASNKWFSREDELYSGIPAASMTSGLVSTIALEGPQQTTFETLVTLSNGNTGIYGFRMWARAADAANNQELGCEISGDQNSTRVAVVRGNDMDVASTTVLLGFPRSMPVTIAMTVAAGGGGTDVRCTFAWPGITRSVKAHVAEMPPGRVAFGVENLAANVSALAIYERDDIAPL